jgi:hypothetical protein
MAEKSKPPALRVVGDSLIGQMVDWLNGQFVSVGQASAPATLPETKFAIGYDDPVTYIENMKPSG